MDETSLNIVFMHLKWVKVKKDLKLKVWTGFDTKINPIILISDGVKKKTHLLELQGMQIQH